LPERMISMPRISMAPCPIPRHWTNVASKPSRTPGPPRLPLLQSRRPSHLHRRRRRIMADANQSDRRAFSCLPIIRWLCGRS
jgi:hypothetical protein